jgi:hypothetical protein
MMEESIAAKERYRVSGAENTESWFVVIARAPDDQLSAHYLEYAWVRVWPSLHAQLPHSKITLFHERCPYDGAFLQSFNRMMDDPTFAYRQYFNTIVPMGWEDCIPLQPADLMAYENFKEGLRQLPG